MVEFGVEIMFLPEMPGQFIKVVVAQRFNSAALAAHKVVVRCLIDNFIQAATGNFGPGDQIQFAKKIEGAIDGGLIDFGGFEPDQLVNFAGRQVVALLADSIQDQLPLRSHTVAHLAYVSNVVAVIVRHRKSLIAKICNSKLNCN